MLGLIWKMLLVITDWRTLIRNIRNIPAIDVVFISNMRDETDRKIFFGKKKITKEHANMHRIWFDNKIAGRIRCINSMSSDLLNLSGRKNYKRQIKSVVQWASKQKVKVVLFAASTKRLIDDGKILSEQYPNILFTIGDNGTVVILRNETLKILERCGMSQNNCKILIIGPYGFLGEAMVKSLLEKNYEVIGLGSNISGLKRIQSEYGIDVFENYEKIGKVDIAIACTHSDSVRLNEDNIDLIRKEKRKLLVVDVSEPSNLSKKEYLKCKNKVIRIDAGNAYSKNIKYVLGYISYKMLRLQRGITFGCFSESLVLASEMSNSDNQQKIIKHNWFEINKINMDLIEGLFEKYSITYPSFRCFGKRVKDFDMNNKLD